MIPAMEDIEGIVQCDVVVPFFQDSTLLSNSQPAKGDRCMKGGEACC